MKINLTVKGFVLGLALTLTPAAALAQSAMMDLGQAAGVDTTALSAQMKGVRALGTLDAVRGNLMIPRDPKDALAECSMLEAKPLMAWNAKQAALLVQTCLNHGYGGRAYTVKAEAARFGVRACPQTAGALSCQAIIEVEGIKITVDGKILTGDSVLMDLNFALNKRGGKLLGFYATLDDKAVIVH